MTTCTQAILWQILWRARWALAGAGAYLLLAIALSHLLTPYVRGQWGDDGVAAVGLFLGAPCGLIIITVIAAFSLSGAGSEETSPPSYMLVLPIRTSTLVGVPMAAGSIAVAAAWLAIACLVLRPADVSAPILWPAAAMIIFLTSFQALAWTPFAQRWAKGVLMVAAITGGFGALLVGVSFGVAQSVITSESIVAAVAVVAAAPLAYFAAFSGVAMARRGDAYDWKWLNRLMARLAVWCKPEEHPFSSSGVAQLWFECRSCGWLLPLFVGGMVWVLPLILVIDPQNRAEMWKQLSLFLAIPMCIAGVAGGSLGSLGGTAPGSRQTAFLFTRPISSEALVRGKLLMAVLSTLATWLVVLPFALLLLLLRPGFGMFVGELAQDVPAWKIAAYPLLAAGLLAALTWKQLVENFWIPLTGRDWVVHLAIVAVILLFFAGMGFGLWINFYPEYQPVARAVAPWLVGLAVALKLLAAGTVLRALDRAQLVQTRSIVAMIGAWCLVVLALSAIALWLLPGGSISVAGLVAGMVLFIPFSRLVGAPLAVKWNRHR